MTNIFNYTGTIQTWMAPSDGKYKIEAYGAQGGSVGSIGGAYHEGGKGAYVAGEFYLKIGDILYILVGGAGSSKAWSDWGGGGGGGTFVVNGTTTTTYKLLAGFNQYVTPLIVAAGGGGAGDDSCGVMGNGQTQAGYGGVGRAQTTTEGAGTTANSVGGAGFVTNGSGGATPPYSFINGGAAGTWSYNGGFGGGGAPYDGGGGGGGWHGGDSPGNNTGMGGYSYNIGINPQGTDGAQSGNGMAIITSITNGVSLVYGFGFTGAKQVWTVPYNGKYKLECWGAAGGIGYGNGNPYGLGGYACGELRLNGGEKLYVYVGEDGVNTSTTPSFNGGGASFASSGHNGGRGGGASDIRRFSDDLDHRIIVAGGGGGAQSTCGGVGTTAGHGGGLIGITSINQTGTGYRGSYASGGTQTSGGIASNNSGQLVIYGKFGIGANSQTCGAGGGGGWYGGGSTYTAGGGGGSSYIETLENAATISGDASMPSAYGSAQTGNSGNGAIKITLLSGGTYHYALYNVDEDKYYILNKCFYNETTDSFNSVTIDYLKDHKNNCYQFMYDINDIVKRMYHQSRSFLPIEKVNMKHMKIVKFDIYDETFNNVILNTNLSSFSNVFNAEKVTIKYNISSDNINNSIVKILSFHQDDNYSCRFVDIENKENIKILIKGYDKFYGKNLKKTELNKILIDGMDGNEINRYELDFLDFDIYIAFKNKTYNQEDILNKISFHTKEFQNMKNISDADFKVFYDKDKDNILIKFNKIFDNVLVNKLDNKEIQAEGSIENF